MKKGGEKTPAKIGSLGTRKLNKNRNEVTKIYRKEVLKTRERKKKKRASVTTEEYIKTNKNKQKTNKQT